MSLRARAAARQSQPGARRSLVLSTPSRLRAQFGCSGERDLERSLRLFVRVGGMKDAPALERCGSTYRDQLALSHSAGVAGLLAEPAFVGDAFRHAPIVVSRPARRYHPSPVDDCTDRDRRAAGCEQAPLPTAARLRALRAQTPRCARSSDARHHRGRVRPDPTRPEQRGRHESRRAGGGRPRGRAGVQAPLRARPAAACSLRHLSRPSRAR